MSDTGMGGNGNRRALQRTKCIKGTLSTIISIFCAEEKHPRLSTGTHILLGVRGRGGKEENFISTEQ